MAFFVFVLEEDGVVPMLVPLLLSAKVLIGLVPLQMALANLPA